jgi:hypothetical protein
VNDIEHEGFGGDGGIGAAKIEIPILAIGALEISGYISVEGQAATLADGGTDELNVEPAAAANVSFGFGGAFRSTNLADIRVDQTQTGLQPIVCMCQDRVHDRML